MITKIDENTLHLVLPYPPSLNRYYRTYQGRVLISEDGRKYRAAIKGMAEALPMRFGGLVHVSIEAWMPDRRKRDLDNLNKALLDALTHSGVIEDDSLIDRLTIYRARDGEGQLLIGGMVKVTICHATTAN